MHTRRSLNSSEPKLWDIDTGLCTKTYHDPENGTERVHQLCVKDNFIACGMKLILTVMPSEYTPPCTGCEPSSVCVYSKESCYPQFSTNLAVSV